MSARGHRPIGGFLTERDRLARDHSNQIGGINHHRLVGAGEWTVNATRDPADHVIFDEMLDEWITAGFVTTKTSVEAVHERRTA